MSDRYTDRDDNLRNTDLNDTDIDNNTMTDADLDSTTAQDNSDYDNTSSANRRTSSRMGEAMHRDWEQTKSDLHMGGRDLNQDIDDTVSQATGKEPVPPRNMPNADTSDFDTEPRTVRRDSDSTYVRDSDDTV